MSPNFPQLHKNFCSSNNLTQLFLVYAILHSTHWAAKYLFAIWHAKISPSSRIRIPPISAIVTNDLTFSSIIAIARSMFWFVWYRNHLICYLLLVNYNPLLYLIITIALSPYMFFGSIVLKAIYSEQLYRERYFFSHKSYCLRLWPYYVGGRYVFTLISHHLTRLFSSPLIMQLNVLNIKYQVLNTLSHSNTEVGVTSY